MTILITGTAGFIGSACALRLLERGDTIIGIDNHNDYYDPALKEARLARHIDHPHYTHLRLDLGDPEAIKETFASYKPQQVIHLAAQTGVRYSLTNPLAYIHSNIVGFTHILEGCRHTEVQHLVYASSSSVYGANTALPFSANDPVDHPLNLYAASKKSNELMAHSYSHLYGLATTGLRFFTVYGPWGRPDMAPFQFTRAILAGEAITLFHEGQHRRDFTYIDDAVEAIIRILDRPAVPNPDWDSVAPDPASSIAPWRLYNIGHSQPVNLMEFIRILEAKLGKQAKITLHPLQPEDVPHTHANIDALKREFAYQPHTPIEEGIARFVDWYRDYTRR